MLLPYSYQYQFSEMSKLTRFVFLLLFVCCYALGPVDTFKWSKSYLQKLIGSTQVSEFTTRPLTRFSPTTNCTRWLENSGDTIVYSYGIDETSSGARALRDCLYREEAKGSREVVRKIELAYPLAGRPSHEQRSLFELVEILPNLESIRYVDGSIDAEWERSLTSQVTYLHVPYKATICGELMTASSAR